MEAVAVGPIDYKITAPLKNNRTENLRISIVFHGMSYMELRCELFDDIPKANGLN